jgi:hypothetical protein
MAATIDTCPNCGKPLAPDAIIDWRPFSCPYCRAFTAPHSAYRRHQQLGCLAPVVLCCAVAALLGFHWLWGLAIGLISGVLMSVAIFRTLTKFRPRPPRLRPYIFRTQTDLHSLADFLESIAAANEWNEQLDHRFTLFWDWRSRDDWLEEAALDSADDYRTTLTGNPPRKKSRVTSGHSLEDQRKVLCAIATDLRIAGNASRIFS